MSASELSDTLKRHIFDLFKSDKINVQNFENASRATVFTKYKDSKALRSAYNSAKSGQTSIVSVDSTRLLFNQIIAAAKKESMEDAAKEILNAPGLIEGFIAKLKVDFASSIENVGLSQNDLAIRIRNIPIKTVRDEFIFYLETNSQINPALLNIIASEIQTGHLAGVFTYKIVLALGANISIGATYRDITISFKDKEVTEANRGYTNLITQMTKLLLDADYVTSGLTNRLDIFTTATKETFDPISNNFTSVLQFTGDNGDAGIAVLEAGEKLNKLISIYSNKNQLSNADLDRHFTDLIKSMQPVVDLIIEKAKSVTDMPTATDLKGDILKDTASFKNVIDILVKSKGSASMYEAPVLHILSILRTGLDPKAEKTVVKASKKIVGKDSDGKQISKVIKGAITQLDKAKKLIKKQQQQIRIKNTAAKTTNLVNLQNIINQGLAKQIQSNMGTGSATKVLNYRTGRLAESAKVETMSESRQGMITAFYSYMRNPYQYAFGEGGSQEFPTSRNPKLLIAQSIRQLAGTQVANRMRAVLV